MRNKERRSLPLTRPSLKLRQPKRRPLTNRLRQPPLRQSRLLKMLLRLKSRQTLIKHLLPLLRPLVTPNPLMLQRPRLLNKLTLASRSRKPSRLWSKPRPTLRKPRGKLPRRRSRPRIRPSRRLRQPLLMPRIRLMLQPLLLTRLLSQCKLLQYRWHLSSHNSYLLLLFSNSQQSSRHQAARNRRARGSKIPPPLPLTTMTRRKRAHFRS